MIKRLALLLLVILAAAYFGAEVLAADYAEKRMAAYIVEREPLIKDPKVSMSRPVVLGLLMNSTIRKVKVASDRPNLGLLTAERVEATLSGTHIDRGASISQQKVVVTSIDSIEVSVDVSEEQASRVLPTGFRFTFDSTGVTLAGRGLRVKGQISSAGTGVLKFKANGSLPVTVSVPLLRYPRLPLVECLPEVRATQGILKLTCKQFNPPIPSQTGP